MARRECTELLHWALPRLGFRWEGYIKVRRQVCRRLDARRQVLELPDLQAYREHLERHPDEWLLLDELCRITISRFYRDAMVFDALRELLAERSASRRASQGSHAQPLRAWSAGCASGEEAWTLRLLCGLDERIDDIQVVATDSDPHMIMRARAGRYPASSLRELSTEWRNAGFHTSKDAMRLRDEWRHGVDLQVQDLREQSPAGPFDLVLCRNLAFMYFDEAGQAAALDRLLGSLTPGGLLVVGRNDASPSSERLQALSEAPGIFRYGEADEAEQAGA